MHGDLAQEAAESELYRHMKCSQGGLILLIRLRAQLDGYPLDWLRMVALSGDPDVIADVEKAVVNAEIEIGDEAGPASTLGWLERKFGRANAARALRETIGEIVDANGRMDQPWI
jgi:hypothetical protein